MEIFLIPINSRICKQFQQTQVTHIFHTELVERPENAPTDRQQVEHRIPKFAFSNIYENVYNNAEKKEGTLPCQTQ